MTVAVILNPSYCGIEELSKTMPVWAVDSPPHRSVAERSWKSQGMADAFQGITLFKVAVEKDIENNLVNIMHQVDLHHGVYSTGSKIAGLKVIGAPLSDRLRNMLQPYGFLSFEDTSDGFVAHL